MDEERSHADLLRQRAEDALRGRAVDLEGLQREDLQSLLHELQVHQIELTLQNEVLRQTQVDLTTSRDLYSDLYDEAPVGYCTLDRKDRILEANQTLATLLGVERNKLIHAFLSHFVARADQDAYYLHRRQAFKEQRRLGCEIHLVKSSGETMEIHLESVTVPGDASQLRVTLSDVTELRRTQKEALEATTLREVQHRLLDQREKERQQIARDLHDGPVQELTGVTFVLRGLLMDNCAPEMAEQLEAIQTTLQSQINELRTYTSELRPPTLAKFGLEQAIRSHAESFQEKHPTIRIQLEMNQTGPMLTEATGLALFRIYQQALANILKHTQANQALVRFEKNDHQVHLEIQDNGAGFEPPQDLLDLARNGHLGLLGMQERAEAVGGTFTLRSHPGEGTQIQVSAPLHDVPPDPA
jgi:PAS domain S-box-containing protein